MAMALVSDQITAPIREFARLAGIGESTAWDMVRGGRVQTISIGKRRLVVLASYRRYIEAQLAEPPKDARRNATVPSLGSTKQQLTPADLTLRVDELALSTRATNCLLNDQVSTLGQLVQKTERDLIEIPNFGRACLAEVNAALARCGLHLGMLPLPELPPLQPPRTGRRRRA
jgi:RNA polymerase alpha subunit